MSMLHTIVVVHTTATGGNANTDGHFQLRIYDEFDNELFKEKFHDITSEPGADERELGQTDAYHFNVSKSEIDFETISRIEMKKITLLDNNWIPFSIFVVGLADDRSYVLGAHPRWRGTFTKQNPTHEISGIENPPS